MGCGEESLIDLADQHQIVHYESHRGEVHSFTLDEAQRWFQAGYFNSEMKFIIAPQGAKVRKREWRKWTLNELIDRNGRSMPFVMCDEERRKKEMDVMNMLSEELDDLGKRRLDVLTSLQPLHARLVAAQSEMRQMEQRIEASDSSYERDKMMSMRETSRSSSFLPSFFCPQAFRQCAIRNPTRLRYMDRIGPKVIQRPVPLDGPLAILDCCYDPKKKVPGDAWEGLKGLLKFYEKDCLWIPFFNQAYPVCLKLYADYDSFNHPAIVFCQMCEEPIRSIRDLMDHITSYLHKVKMEELGSSVDREAFSFWKEAIDRSFEGPDCWCQEWPQPTWKPQEFRPIEGAQPEEDVTSLVVETEEPQEENMDEIHSTHPLSRDEVMQVGEVVGAIMLLKLVETRQLFRPRFFCPKAFRVVASKKSTALHEMNRVCCANRIKASSVPLPLEGPLAILTRCDNPDNQVKADPVATLKRLWRFRQCDRGNMIIAMSQQMGFSLRTNYDDYDHQTIPVFCGLCDNDVRIGSHWNLLCHVTSLQHRTKVEQLGTGIDKRAFEYWHKIIWSY